MRVLPWLLLVLATTACADPPRRAPDPRSPVAPEPAPRPKAALRVITYNAWALPLVAKDLGMRSRRIAEALPRLDADVICLQEMFDPVTNGRVRGALADGWTEVPGRGGGLMVFSRLPVTKADFTPFPHYPGLAPWERLAGKGVFEVVVETEAGDVRVVTAHLALAFGEDNPRSAQLGFLLDRLADRELPTVLAADLNTAPVDDGRLDGDYRRILEAGFVSADPPRQADDGTFIPPTPTRLGWPRYVGLPRHVFWPDHVLVRSGADVSVDVVAYAQALDDEATAASDHNLLLADLRVSPR